MHEFEPILLWAIAALPFLIPLPSLVTPGVTAAAMLAVYADDVVEMPPNMPLRSGKAAAEAAASADTSPQPSTFSLTSAETEGVGDLAYDRGSYSFSMSMEGMPEPMTDTGKYIVLLRRQADGSWLMTATIWNSDLPVAGQEM